MDSNHPSKLLSQVRPELKAFEGKELTADNRKAIEGLVGGNLRFLGPGMAGTMEYRVTRTTVYTNEANVITRIAKG